MNHPDLLNVGGAYGQETYPFVVELAANHLGCRPDELVKWRMEGDLLVVIAPDGRKFKYTVDQVKAMADEFPDPMVTPPTVEQAATSTPASDIAGSASPEAAPVVASPAENAGPVSRRQDWGSTSGGLSPKQ